MSWDQEYYVPSVDSLYTHLAKISPRELLQRELKKQGIVVDKVESFVLDEDCVNGNIEGQRVYLSDGRVFEPKLIRKETADGNWGRDIYDYKLKEEPVEVENVDLSFDNLQMGNESGCCGECGCSENTGC